MTAGMLAKGLREHAYAVDVASNAATGCTRAAAPAPIAKIT